MGKKASPVKGYKILCTYDHPSLSIVCTLHEACFMWQRSETAIRNDMYKHKIEARKSFTGGDWLISTASLIKLYGEPKEDTLWQLHGSN